jgi:hypothetical protein
MRFAADARSILQCCGVRLRRSDTDRVVERHDKDLSITDVPRVRRLGDRLDSLVDQLARDRDFNFDLGWQQSRRIFSAAIHFREPFLSPMPFHFRRRHSRHADPEKGFAHLVELERLDYGDDQLHADTLRRPSRRHAGFPAGRGAQFPAPGHAAGLGIKPRAISPWIGEFTTIPSRFAR